MKRFLTLFGLLISCVVVPVFSADSDMERLRPIWQALDANQDGKVALEELHPMQAGLLKRHDGDGDGLISLSEYAAYDFDPGSALQIPIPAGVRLIEDIPYAATDDPRQTLDIYLPDPPAVSGPLPVIAYLHGGGWTMGSKVSARPQMLPLVASGRFAAVSIGYRLSWQEPWPAQIHDVKAGIRWIRAHAAQYGLDPARICAFGPSAGGHLAAMLGTTNGVAAAEGTLGENTGQSSDVQCAVDFFGPADLRGAAALDPLGKPSIVTQLLGGAAVEHPDMAAEASPVFQVDAGDVPFFIVHGTDDPLVAYSDSVKLAAALEAAKVPVVFQTVEGGGHGSFGAAMETVNERVVLFLEQQFYDPDIEVPADNLRTGP